MRRADFSAASDLFGMSGVGVLGEGPGGVGTGVPCQQLVLGGWCRWCQRSP